MEFKDGKVEEWDKDYFHRNEAESSIPIGSVGNKFIRDFRVIGGKSWFSGRVIRILPSGKLKCRFDEDNREYTYTLEEVQSFAQNKVVLQSNAKEDDHDGSDDKDENTIEVESDDDNEEDDIDGKKTPTKVTSGKYFHQLVKLGLNQSLQDRIDELQSRPTAMEAFTSAMQYPQKILKKCYEALEVDGRKVTVLAYPTEENVVSLHELLKHYDPSYSENYRSKGDLKRMPLINEFLSDKDHC